MKRYEVVREINNARAIILGEYKNLYPGDSVIVFKDDREWSAIVETRVFGGAVVKLVLER